MYTLFIVLTILACVLLVFVVLIQNPKGGGLASNFAGSNNLMGVQRTGDILEKGTWVLVVSIMVFSLLINITNPGMSSGSNKGIDLQRQITPTTSPSAPLQSPATPTPVAPQEQPAATDSTN
ncbi:preprotein translocase subunit SecG [Olivibacter sp. SDN3]|uniref:preprotein translocase subunit SecG n=1 Tax=Olivibacter sp. SDN3 TaxID=2764720 RepID=UPI00165160F9|nr:preprotein translocase subunit SecG [Olivibacter sp. SDN3]QNL50700.1 preprotein translocase subunit SecG [Olivibacter sp. SDN3]